MTLYASAGPAEPGGVPVYAVDEGAALTHLKEAVVEHVHGGHPAAEELDPRTDLRNHSPTGFSWGYRGSGPAQLALAVLAHDRGDEYAVENYQEFKERLVAAAPRDEPFRCTTSQVSEVLG
jgi:hypothetical protein